MRVKVCVENEIWRPETPIEAGIIRSFTGTEIFKEPMKFIVCIRLSVMREF